MRTATLLYDEDCGFCRWSVNEVLRWGRRGSIRAIPLQSAEADGLLGDMDPIVRTGSAHLVTPEGHVHSGGALIDPLFQLLPGGSPISFVARSLPETSDRVYRWVARHRFRISELFGMETCLVGSDATGKAAR